MRRGGKKQTIEAEVEGRDDRAGGAAQRVPARRRVSSAERIRSRYLSRLNIKQRGREVRPLPVAIFFFQRGFVCAGKPSRYGVNKNKYAEKEPLKNFPRLRVWCGRDRECISGQLWLSSEKVCPVPITTWPLCDIRTTCPRSLHLFALAQWGLQGPHPLLCALCAIPLLSLSAQL